MLNSFRASGCKQRQLFRMFSQSQGDGLKAFGNVLGGEQICPKALGTFTAWHEAVSAKMNGTVTDENIMAERLSPHVHKEVVFEPPTYYKGYKGNEEFLTLLNCVGEVFGKSFVYGRQWLSPDGRDWALEFSAEIGDSKKKMDGIDLVSLDEDGKIISFRVLARPPNAVAELKDIMMRKAAPRLIALKAKQAMGSLFK